MTISIPTSASRTSCDGSTFHNNVWSESENLTLPAQAAKFSFAEWAEIPWCEDNNRELGTRCSDPGTNHGLSGNNPTRMVRGYPIFPIPRPEVHSAKSALPIRNAI